MGPDAARADSSVPRLWGGLLQGLQRTLLATVVADAHLQGLYTDAEVVPASLFGDSHIYISDWYKLYE